MFYSEIILTDVLVNAKDILVNVKMFFVNVKGEKLKFEVAKI